MIFHAILAIAHLLAAAAWFGAMCYSAFILHPRAHWFFSNAADFEAFIATISHGARWKVLAALVLIGLTGAGFALISGARSATWRALHRCEISVLPCRSWFVRVRVLAAVAGPRARGSERNSTIFKRFFAVSPEQ